MELDYGDLVSMEVVGEAGSLDINALRDGDGQSQNDGLSYWDDVSGRAWDGKLVEAARREEISEAEAMKVWKNVPNAEAYAHARA